MDLPNGYTPLTGPEQLESPNLANGTNYTSGPETGMRRPSSVQSRQ